MKGYANAKINLALQVKGKRKDGYHELDMIMAPIDLYDTITVDILEDEYETIVEFTDYSIPATNTVTKAIDLLRARYHFKDKLAVYVHKHIPSEAGLGGGSADAAFVLRAVKELLNLPISNQELIDIAKEIGADVPFFLENKIARVQGIGEKIIPITIKDKPSLLIVKPFKGCSTKMVFDNFDNHPITEHQDLEKAVECLKKGEYTNIEEYLTNELLDAANKECGDIKRIIAQLKEDGFTWVSMSGSGSVVFAVSFDEEKLIRAEQFYKSKGYYVVLSSII